MTGRVDALTAWEILDSRGRPTVAARIVVDGNAGEASVPSGASTGAAEAVELRDGDPARYRGLGTLKAVGNVRGRIADAIVGKRLADQRALDSMLVELDGTEDKHALGANAILAVSIAFARAAAIAAGMTLVEQLRSIAGTLEQPPRLPRPTINLFSGGKHAGRQVPIQDVLIVPQQSTISECLCASSAVYYAAVDLVARKYNARALKADEGGLAPPFRSVEDMFDDAVASICAAGFEPGKDVRLAVDVASTHFFNRGKYALPDAQLDAARMIERIRSWTRNWPIISVEDGLAEDDWDHWPALRRVLAPDVITLGDDLLCTNPARIRRAIDARACDALLLKVNQIGTLSEAADALRAARSAGWNVVVSARSGETEDDWLADLAVAWAGDFIKVGSICQGERLAKYNRLLRLEAESEFRLL